MKSIILFILCLVACDPVPEPINTEVDPPSGAGFATEIARLEWESRLSMSLPDPPEIRWFAGDCLWYNGYNEFDTRCYTGYYFNRYSGMEIQVIWRELPSYSTLAHELLHWALDMAGDSDNNHEHPFWREDLAEVELLQYGAGV